MLFANLSFVSRAITIVIALCLFPAQSQEGLELFQEAESLLLQGKRQEAIESVLELTKLIDGNRLPDDLYAKVVKYATFFVTEEGQKLFELGESMSESSPELAESKYQAALEKEGENVKILNALAILKISQANCKDAQPWISRSLKAFPQMAHTRLVQLITHDCLSDFEAITEVIKKTPAEDHINKSLVYKIFVARSDIKNGNSSKGIALLRDISSEQSSPPDVWFWRWKLDPEQGQLQSQHLTKYLKLCKSMSPRLKRKYKESGVLCTHLSEAEVALKESGVIADEPKTN